MKQLLSNLGISLILINNSGITNEEAHDLLEMHGKGQLTKAEIIEELREQSDETTCDTINENGYAEIGTNPWAFTEFFSASEQDEWE